MINELLLIGSVILIFGAVLSAYKFFGGAGIFYPKTGKGGNWNYCNETDVLFGGIWISCKRVF